MLNGSRLLKRSKLRAVLTVACHQSAHCMLPCCLTSAWTCCHTPIWSAIHSKDVLLWWIFFLHEFQDVLSLLAVLYALAIVDEDPVFLRYGERTAVLLLSYQGG